MNQSGIRDNHSRGNVGEFLKDKIQEGSKLSFVSALLNVDGASRSVQESAGTRLSNASVESTRKPMPTKLARRHSGACDREPSSTIQSIETFVATANTPSHPIRTQLLRLTAECESARAPSDLFAVIKQEGKV